MMCAISMSSILGTEKEVSLGEGDTYWKESLGVERPPL